MRLLTTFLLACAACLGAEPFFFIQVSDPQFGMETRNMDFAQETASFEFVVATINRLRPAFVVITGDLINKEGDDAQAKEFLRIAAKLEKSIPLYNAPGNHDVGNEPTAATLAAYRGRFGRDYYSFRHGTFAGFVLDSSIISEPKHVPDELKKQEAWLRQELASAKAAGAQHLVIFQHHSWFLERGDEPNQYFNIPLERRKPYLDLFHESGVKALFSGHYHRNAYGRDGDLEMVTSGPSGKPLGKDQSGIRVVIVRDSGIEHRYYELGSLPQHIEIK
ncbi:MAG: metallophosphoesterase [Bryobacteraceae bacterium]